MSNPGDASINEPHWTGGTRQKKARKYLWNALKHSYPEQLTAQLWMGVEQGLFSANEALVFPLSGAVDKPLSSLVHAHPQWPDHTRDQRLLAWFQGAHEVGADPATAVRGLHDRASSAMVRLMKMQAMECLDWWRRQGIERHLRGHSRMDGDRMNLAELAFSHGRVNYLDIALAQGDKLEQAEKLWPLVWSKPCMAASDKLLVRLMAAHGSPPAGVMSWWAGAWVNKNNIDSMIESGRRLIQAGADPNEAVEGLLPALGAATRRIVSASAERVVAFLLEHGADPLAQFQVHDANTGQHGQVCALEVAMHTWIKTSINSALRPTARENFLALARSVPAHAMCALYPPERQAQVLKQMQGGMESPHARQDAALLEGVWLQAAVSPINSPDRAGPRL